MSHHRHRYHTRSKSRPPSEESKLNEDDIDCYDQHKSNHNKKEIDLKALECPVCLELPPNIIWCCKNGHLVCKDCYESIEKEDRKCPTCRVSMFIKYRNIIVEQVLSLREVNCKNDGCQKRVLFSELPNHLKQCDFRPTTCKYKLLGCDWNGCVKNASHHEHKCKYRKIPTDEIMNILRNLTEEKANWKKLGKYEQVQDIEFMTLSEHHYGDKRGLEEFDVDDITKCFISEFQVYDDHQRDNLNVECLMVITVNRSRGLLNYDLHFTLQFMSSCECGSNHFEGSDYTLAFGIADYYDEFDEWQPIEFESISDSRRVYLTEPVRLDGSTVSAIRRRSRVKLKMYHLHAKHQYVFDNSDSDLV